MFNIIFGRRQRIIALCKRIAQSITSCHIQLKVNPRITSVKLSFCIPHLHTSYYHFPLCILVNVNAACLVIKVLVLVCYSTIKFPYYFNIN